MVGRKVPSTIISILLVLLSTQAHAASDIGGFCNEYGDNDVTCSSGLVCAGRLNSHFAFICLPSSMSPGRIDIDSTWYNGRCYGSYIEHRTTGGASWFADFETQFTRSEWEVYDDSMYTFCGVTMYHAEVYRSDVDPGWDGTGWDGPVAYAWKATDGTNYWFSYQNEDPYGKYGPEGNCGSYSIPANALDYAICNVEPAADGEPAGEPVREYACSSGHAANGICCATGKTCCTSDGQCPSGQYCGNDHYCVTCDDECAEGSTGCTDDDTRWSCAREGSCWSKSETACASGKECSDGSCITTGVTDGESCSTDDDCTGDTSVCGPLPTLSPSGPVGRVCCISGLYDDKCCATDDDCEPLSGNYICNTDYHRCTLTGSAGLSPCSSDGDCESETCHKKSGASTGLCCPASPPKWTKCCKTDNDCDSGSCDTQTNICDEAPDLVELYDTCYNDYECESGDCNMPSDNIPGICCDPSVDGGVCCISDAYCDSSDCDEGSHRCRAKKDDGESCSSDDECENNNCYNGICQQKKKDDGESCSSDTGCESDNCNNGLCCKDGSYCCKSSSDCPGTYYCERKDYRCINKKDNGDTCSSEEMCASGNCCESKCMDPSVTCCQSNGDCPDGYSCDTTYNLCKEDDVGKKSISFPCSSDDECDTDSCCGGKCQLSILTCCADTNVCKEGYFCHPSMKTCSKLHAIGEKCSEDYECVSGNCMYSICCASGKSCCKDDGKCPSGQECGPAHHCVDRAPEPVLCVHGCSAGERGCNSETQRWTCREDSDGCLYKADDTCPEGEVCDTGQCVVPKKELCGSTDVREAVELEDSYNGITTRCQSPGGNKVFYKVHAFQDTPFIVHVSSFKEDRSITVVVKDSDLDIVKDLSSSSSEDELRTDLARGGTYIIELRNIDKGYLVTFTFDDLSVDASDGCGGPKANDNRRLVVEPGFAGDCYGLSRDQWYLLEDAGSSFVPPRPLVVDFRTFGPDPTDRFANDGISKMKIIDTNENIKCESTEYGSDERCTFRWEGAAHGVQIEDGDGLDDILVEVRTEVCGDGACAGKENQYLCCEDCGCKVGSECIGGHCIDRYCGNGECEDDESYGTCPFDCPPATPSPPPPESCTDKDLGVVNTEMVRCLKFDTDAVQYSFRARDTGIYKITLMTFGTDYDLNTVSCGTRVSDDVTDEYIEHKVRLEHGQACGVSVSRSSAVDSRFDLLVIPEGDQMSPDVICGDGNCDASECTKCPQDCSYFVDPDILEDSDSYEERREYILGLRSLKNPSYLCENNRRCEPALGENCLTSKNDCFCPRLNIDGRSLEGVCDPACSVSDERGCLNSITCNANDMFSHILKESFEEVGLVKDCKTVVDDIAREKGVDAEGARKYLKAAVVNCIRGGYKPFLKSIGAEEHDLFEFLCGTYGEFDQMERIHEYKDVLIDKCDKRFGSASDEGMYCIDSVTRMSSVLSLSNDAATYIDLGANLLPDSALGTFTGFWGCINEFVFGITRTYVQMSEGDQFDLDLHVVDTLGRHVGRNYETGEYEVEIPNARTSYDNEGGLEIIYVPMEITFTAYVSAHDAEEEVEEYNLTTGTIVWGHLHKSPKVTEKIARGTMRSHEISSSGPAAGIEITEKSEGSEPISTWADLQMVNVDSVASANVATPLAGAEGPARPETVSGEVRYPIHPGVIAAVVILVLLVAVLRSRPTEEVIFTRAPLEIKDEEEEEEKDIEMDKGDEESAIPNEDDEEVVPVTEGEAELAKRSIPELKKRLKDEDAIVRQEAASVLNKIGKDDPMSTITVVPALITLLKDDIAGVRGEAVDALCSIGLHRPEVIKLAIGPLSKTLSDPVTEVRVKVAHSLVQFAAQDPSLVEPAVPALESALDDDDDKVRKAAKGALDKRP